MHLKKRGNELVNVDKQGMNANLALLERNNTSTRDYSKGDFLNLKGLFKKVINNIEIGDAFSDNVNIKNTTIGEELKEINNSLNDNGKSFKFGYNTETDQFGYYREVSGADTFVPFSGRLIKLKNNISISDVEGRNTINISNQIKNYKYATTDDFILVATEFHLDARDWQRIMSHSVYGHLEYSYDNENGIIKIEKCKIGGTDYVDQDHTGKDVYAWAYITKCDIYYIAPIIQ